MSQATRAVLLVRQGLVFLDDQAEGPAQPEAYVLAIGASLAQLGYVPSTELARRLGRLSVPALTAMQSWLWDTLAAKVGGDRKHVPLFRSFPWDIPRDTEDLWWRKVIVHYAQASYLPCLFCGSVGSTHVLSPCRHVVCEHCWDGETYSACPVCEHAVDRGSPFFRPDPPRAPGVEQIRFTRLDVGDDLAAAARALFVSLCTRTQPLSPDDKDALAALLGDAGERALAWVPDVIAVRETRAAIFGMLFRAVDPARVLPVAVRHLTTATDVLRLIAAMSDHDPALLLAPKVVERPVAAGGRWAAIPKLATAEPAGARGAAIGLPPDPAPTTCTARIAHRRFRIARMSRPLRRALLGVLAALDPDRMLEDVLRHARLWVWVGQMLHPGEHARAFPAVAAAFAIARGGPATVATFAQRADAAAKAGDARAYLGVIRTRPGELGRRLDHALRLACAPRAVATPASTSDVDAARTADADAARTVAASASASAAAAVRTVAASAADADAARAVATSASAADADAARAVATSASAADADAARTVGAILDAFRAATPSLATPMLLTLRGHLPTRRAPAAVRVFWPKAAAARGVSAPDTRPPLPVDAIAAGVRAIDDELLRRFAALPAFEDAVLDHALRGVVVPFVERSASRAAVALPRGSKIDVPASKLARMFLHWCEPEHGRTTDLDLSVAFYSAAWAHTGTCSYYVLTYPPGAEPVARSAGDLRSAPFPEGATEFVDLDRAGAAALGVRYAVMVVNAFAGLAFSELERGFAGLMLRDDEGGAHFDPRTVALRFDLQGEHGMYVPLVFDLDTSAMHWLDLSAPGQIAFNNVATSTKTITAMVPALLAYFASGVRASMFELGALHAAARCRRVHVRGPTGVCSVVRRADEPTAAFLARILAADPIGETGALPALDAPMFAALYRGDLPVHAASSVYALFVEQPGAYVAAAALLAAAPKP